MFQKYYLPSKSRYHSLYSRSYGGGGRGFRPLPPPPPRCVAGQKKAGLNSRVNIFAHDWDWARKLYVQRNRRLFESSEEHSKMQRLLFRFRFHLSFFLIYPGVGLGLQSGERWRSTRKLLNPAFHFEKIKPYIKIFQQSADILLVRSWLSIPSLKYPKLFH